MLKGKRVVVLPDVYVDVLVPMPAWSEAAKGMTTIAAHGGGNLPVGPLSFRAGGNAANLALGLARLGASVSLVGVADPLGLALLHQARGRLEIDTSCVDVATPGPATVALESPDANVMLSHAGAVRTFGPERLTAARRDAIAEADAVAVVNWAQNESGTALLEAVAKEAQGFLFVDTADPRHAHERIAGLLASPCWRAVDAWGMNENEARAFAEAAGLPHDGPLDAAAALSDRLGVRVDLHTASFAATWSRGHHTKVDAAALRPKHLTGAGDAWNAGDLAGHLLGLEPEERLAMAHRTAAAHLTA